MKYEVFDDNCIDFIKNIRIIFRKSTDCLYTGRNKLKILTYDNEDIVVKSFKIPHFINKIAYTFLRDSKAERSYRNSLAILEFVPKPMGYAEFKSYGLLHDSYFMCEKYEYDFTIRELLKKEDFPNKVSIFKQFATFTYVLHNKGVEHLDYSPGNILIKKIAANKYEFKIVDVNRMTFRVMGNIDRLENFSKLWANDEDLKVIIQTYASLIGMPEEEAIRIVLDASQRHKNKKNFKNKILKYVRKKRVSGKRIEDIKEAVNRMSVVIMVKNAEGTIEECLESLLIFDEVILYFNNSTDNTREIAEKYKNVTIINGDFLGFGKTKNMAATYSSNDWILSLDSDEILNKALLNEMAQMNFDDIKNIYKLKRDNYFLGHKTQESDVIVRIYNRTFTQFNDNNVHEKVIIPVNAEIVKLKNSFTHLNITDINQTLTKMIQYTDLSSEHEKTCFFAIVIAKSVFAFFKIYVLKGNILKGWVGFTLGVNAANRRYYKYIKQYINCKNVK